MIRRVPARNPRSRGIRVKHVLQICLLLGVCFWLIYQIKRSHDKRTEFNENEVKGMVNSDRGTKLGRKDLQPRVPVLTKNDKQEDDEDDEVEAGEEIRKEFDNKLEQEQEEAEWMKRREEDEEEDLDGESKLGVKETEETAVNKGDERGGESKSEEEEEEEPEEDSKKEQMKEDDDTAGGDDDIDEHDQDKLEGEGDHDEEPRDEHKEVQDGEEEDIDVAEREGQVHPDHETSVEDQDLDGGDQDLQGHETSVEEKDLDGGDQDLLDHQTSVEDRDLDGGDQDLDGGDQNAHEAREEIYKADDASSAVTHDTHTLSTESENVNLDENSAMTDLEIMIGITTNGTEGARGDHDQGNDQPSNMTAADDEKLLANSDDQLIGNKSAEVTSKGNNTVSGDISQYDGTNINLEPQLHEKAANDSSLEDNTMDPTRSSESGGTDENHGDSNADSKGGSEERHVPDHSSDTEIGQDEKYSRLDLGTLPDNSSDGVNDRNSAAE